MIFLPPASAAGLTAPAFLRQADEINAVDDVRRFIEGNSGFPGAAECFGASHGFDGPESGIGIMR